MKFILNSILLASFFCFNFVKANLAYITNEKDNTVSVIDIKKKKVVKKKVAKKKKIVKKKVAKKKKKKKNKRKRKK